MPRSQLLWKASAHRNRCPTCEMCQIELLNCPTLTRRSCWRVAPPHRRRTSPSKPTPRSLDLAENLGEPPSSHQGAHPKNLWRAERAVADGFPLLTVQPPTHRLNRVTDAAAVCDLRQSRRSLQQCQAVATCKFSDPARKCEQDVISVFPYNAKLRRSHPVGRPRVWRRDDQLTFGAPKARPRTSKSIPIDSTCSISSTRHDHIERLLRRKRAEP